MLFSHTNVQTSEGTFCRVEVHIFQVLYVLCFTRPRYQVSVYRTIGPLVISFLLSQDLREIFLPPPHGDDDVPQTPEPPDDDDLNSLSSDMEIPLPDDDNKKPKEESAKEDYVKDVDPMMFPLYSLDGSTSTHKPCGKLPLIFYWGKKARPLNYNRQVGT